MLNPGTIAIVMVFSIPILGILLAGWKEFLKFRSKQSQLGSSTRELERDMEALMDRLEAVEAERDALRDRIENLETIVTAEAWDAVQKAQAADDKALPDAARLDPLDLDGVEDRTHDTPAAEEIDAIARRLRER
jgi:predicted nuclease with TOPRIM domain